MACYPFDLHKDNEHYEYAVNAAEEENAFLTKELEDSLDLYNSFIDDIEKVNKVLNGINSKKESIKNEIVDYRRKINIEKDNMAKISVNMKLIQDEIKE